jgi:hypothetical protein
MLPVDLDKLEINDTAGPSNDATAADPAPITVDALQSPKSAQSEGEVKEKKPYVNHERVKTGGAQRVRLLVLLFPRTTVCLITILRIN